MNIYSQWLKAKAAEKEAQDHRRALEDEMIERFEIGMTSEGVENFEDEGFKVKVTCRMNRKVDSDKLQELAAESGLTDHLASLFRWKPELNMNAWKGASEDITKPLLGAITTKPGRPSFNITEEEK